MENSYSLRHFFIVLHTLYFFAIHQWNSNIIALEELQNQYCIEFILYYKTLPINNINKYVVLGIVICLKDYL